MPVVLWNVQPGFWTGETYPVTGEVWGEGTFKFAKCSSGYPQNGEPCELHTLTFAMSEGNVEGALFKEVINKEGQTMWQVYQYMENVPQHDWTWTTKHYDGSIQQSENEVQTYISTQDEAYFWH